jgi:hypothetical protein
MITMLTVTNVRGSHTHAPHTTVILRVGKQQLEPIIHIGQLFSVFPFVFQKLLLTFMTLFFNVSEQAYFFQGERLLAPSKFRKLKDHLLSAVRSCLLNVLAGGRPSILNPRTRHVR